MRRAARAAARCAAGRAPGCAPTPAAFGYRAAARRAASAATRRCATRAAARSRLGALMLGAPPLILALGYFHCPNLCGVVRDDLFAALDATAARAPAATTTLAVAQHRPGRDPGRCRRRRKAARLSPLPSAGVAPAGTTCTGRAAGDRTPSPTRSASAIGSTRAQAVPPSRRPRGRDARRGISSAICSASATRPRDLRSAVPPADAGAVAPPRSRPCCCCASTTIPATGRYTLAIMKLLRLAGVAHGAGIAAALVLLLAPARTGRA